MKTNNLLIILAALLTLQACKKVNKEVSPIPDATVQFRSVDSMKLDSQYFQFIYDATLIDKVNNKQYIINSDKAEMKFSIEPNNKFSIEVTDQANTARETKLYISFDNRTVNNISGTYSLSAPGTCVEWLQVLENSTGSSFFVRTLTCEQIMDGTITTEYDPATNTISGKIERLKYLFNEYIPLYVNGYRPPPYLSSFLGVSGSSRNQEIIFKNVRQR